MQNTALGNGTPLRRVERVSCYSDDGEYGMDRVELACGHSAIIGHDDENGSLVGAETECDECDALRAIVDPDEIEDTLARYGHNPICASRSGWRCDCPNGRP